MPNLQQLYGGSPWMPPAFEFYREMTGPDAGGLVSGAMSDEAFSDPIYNTNSGWGNLMYGGGTELPFAGRATKLGQAVAGGTAAGSKRRAKGASDWLNLSDQFAGANTRLNQAQQANKQNQWDQLSSLIGEQLSSIISGSPGNIFSQLLTGGAPLGNSFGIPNIMQGANTLGGLNPAGGGLSGLIASMGAGGAAAGFGGGAAGLGAAATAGGADAGSAALIDLLATGAFL
jgi:hypothetical protein